MSPRLVSGRGCHRPDCRPSILLAASSFNAVTCLPVKEVWPGQTPAARRVRIASVPRFNFTSEFFYKSVEELEKDAKAELQVARIVSLRDCAETGCAELHSVGEWV